MYKLLSLPGALFSPTLLFKCLPSQWGPQISSCNYSPLLGTLQISYSTLFIIRSTFEIIIYLFMWLLLKQKLQKDRKSCLLGSSVVSHMSRQFLAHGKCFINICWGNEWIISLVPGTCKWLINSSYICNFHITPPPRDAASEGRRSYGITVVSFFASLLIAGSIDVYTYLPSSWPRHLI